MKSFSTYEQLYRAIRQYDSKQAAVTHIKDLIEIHEIWSFYEQLTLEELRLIGAAIKKTEAQLGYIPFCFTTVPFVFLVFSAKLSNLFSEDLLLLISVIIILTLIAIYLIHLHFKHKSYNALHRHIVESLIQMKQPAKGS